MYYVWSADEAVKDRCAYCSEQITQNVGYDDDSCRKLDVEIFSEAHQQDHGHCQQCEQQFVFDAGKPTAQGYYCVQQCERMYDPHGFYVGKRSHLFTF